MSFASKGNIVTVPVTNMKWPEQGATSSFLGQFAMPGNYSLELNKHETAGKVDLPQTLFFDASLSTGPVIISFSGTQQTLTLPPQAAGYLPILTPDQASFTIAGAGGGSIGLSFISVPLPASVWSTSAGGASTVTAEQGLPNTAAEAWSVYVTQGGAAVSSGNPLPTDDINLATAIAGGVVAVHDASSEASLATIASTTTQAAPSASSPYALQVAGEYNPSLGTLTNGQSAALQLQNTGRLLVADTSAETYLSSLVTETTATVTALTKTTTPVAAGAATATGADLIGLQYNGIPIEMTAGQQAAALANSYGSLLVDTEVLSPTYSCVSGPTIAASAANVPGLWIQGSATKTIRIKRIILSFSGAASTTETVISTLRRYSGATAFTGTGLTTQVIAQFDINDAASTAVVTANGPGGAITATPVAGAMIRINQTIINAAGSSSSVDFDFTSGGKSPVLRGTSDWICLAFSNSGTVPVATGISIDWTEV
jgi:hypothetical protein